MYSDKVNVNILTSLLSAHGVHHVVVCPGSRNAALVHNFNECPSIECHPVTDERSAGFFALGMRQTLDEPVAVCVTSGSALLNLLPAVAEATYRHQGIIVISADRPSAWTGQLDGQTMPQTDALGRFVAYSAALSEPADEIQRWECNRCINEALLINARPDHPSVQINVPISEPLFNFKTAGLPKERIIRSLHNSRQLPGAISKMKRPMLVLGQLPQHGVQPSHIKALASIFPVLFEPLSLDMDEPCLTDQLISVLGDAPAAYRPDCVIFAGGNTISKRLRHFLRTSCADAYHITISEDGSLQDISCHTRLLVHCTSDEAVTALHEASPVIKVEKDYHEAWTSLRCRILSRHISFEPDFSEMLAVKLLEERVRKQDMVHYANSMSVRLGSVYAGGFRFCNRGLNGIDGSVSTAAGASAAVKGSEGKLYCVCGDLSFFYDSNALWPADLGGNLRILLLNNGKGGIFKSLPGLNACPLMEKLVSGRHSMNAEGLCRQFGVKHIFASNASELERGIEELCGATSEKPVLLEVVTDAETDQKVYKKYYQHISDELE